MRDITKEDLNDMTGAKFYLGQTVRLKYSKTEGKIRKIERHGDGTFAYYLNDERYPWSEESLIGPTPDQFVEGFWLGFEWATKIAQNQKEREEAALDAEFAAYDPADDGPEVEILRDPYFIFATLSPYKRMLCKPPVLGAPYDFSVRDAIRESRIEEYLNGGRSRT